MNKVTAFADQNPICWLAAVENSNPCVRGVLIPFVDGTGFCGVQTLRGQCPQPKDKKIGSGIAALKICAADAKIQEIVDKICLLVAMGFLC